MKQDRPIGGLLRKRAISLIEGVLYLVVALAVIVGGIVFFQQSQLSNNVTDTARAAVGISSQARALYQNQTGFGDNEDLTLAMIRSGAVPSNFIDNTGDAIAHPFGGGVTITGNGPGFVISYQNMSRAACIRLASIDPNGTGPMGIGMVGLTFAQGDPVDPTAAPEMTGTVNAEEVSASCSDGTEMAVYYAQNPGAKYTEATVETEEPVEEPSGFEAVCSSGGRSMQTSDIIYQDNRNNGTHTRIGFYLDPGRRWTLNFGVNYEQEVYQNMGVQPDGRVYYKPTFIYPASWHPCIDDQGLQPPSDP